MKRDPDAAQRFEQETLPHLRSLLSTALRVTGHRQDAEDLVQETFLRAWKSFHTFRPGTNMKAWLFRILFNAWARRRRRVEHQQDMVSMDDPAVLEEMPQVDAGQALDHCSAREVLEAVDRLPQDQRVVLVLVAGEGFTCQEAADLLKVPIGTVMSRLSRARVAVRQLLATDIHSAAPPSSDSSEPAKG